MENNTLNYSIYWSQFDKIPDYVYHIEMVACAIIFIGGASVNFFLIGYFLRYSELRTAANYFSMNLILANLIMIFMNMPFIIISCYYKKWIFGKLGCNIYGISAGISGFMSIGTMTVMSIEKYLLVRKPFLRLTHRKQTILWCIFGVWIYSVILGSLQLFSNNQFVLEGLMTACTFDYLSRDSFTTSFNNVMLIFGFFLPLGLISSSYIFIVRILKERYGELNRDSSKNRKFLRFTSNQRRRNAKGDIRVINLIEVTDDKMKKSRLGRVYGDNLCRIKRIYEAPERKSIKIGIQSTICFCSSWLPYVLLVVLAAHLENPKSVVTPYTTAFSATFAKLSTLYCPLFYLVFYRKSIQKPVISTNSNTKPCSYV